MIFRTASLLVCTLLLVYLANSSARCEDNSKKSEAPKKYSLEFMGEAQVIIPKLRYDGSHPITLEARVKPYSRDDDFVRSSVVANLQLAGVGIHYSRGRWLFHVNEGRDMNAGYASTVSNEDVELDKTIHIAGVYDGKNVWLFVDGKRQTSVNETTLKHVPSPYDFMIGADPNGKGKPHQFFKGVIDEVRISKVARYTEDFKPASSFKPDKDTLVLYHFDEGKGMVANDESGNEYHGSIHGATWVNEITRE